MEDCEALIDDSIRRRMGEEEVTPDSRFRRWSRSAIVGASLWSSRVVVWKVC